MSPNERAAKWYLGNKERAMEAKRLRREDTRKALLEAAQNRARTKGIALDIKYEDIHVPEVCPVLGIKLERGKGRFRPTSPSLDRIDPQLGYVKGNVQVISNKANTMKSNASKEELIAFAKWVLATHKEDV